MCLLCSGVLFGREENGVQRKNLGMLKGCPEQGMDKVLSAVLTSAVCVCGS